MAGNTLIGAIIAALSLLVAYLGYQLNKQKEVKSETIQDAQLRTQLDYISKGVDDIRIDLKANEKQMIALGERVKRVEESAKQAHKRIDTIQEELNKS
jgi:S-adenosylmethionine:tRNA-ribosyltransferase-isomerase (queuine synthetase)